MKGESQGNDGRKIGKEGPISKNGKGTEKENRFDVLEVEGEPLNSDKSKDIGPSTMQQEITEQGRGPKILEKEEKKSNTKQGDNLCASSISMQKQTLTLTRNQEHKSDQLPATIQYVIRDEVLMVGPLKHTQGTTSKVIIKEKEHLTKQPNIDCQLLASDVREEKQQRRKDKIDGKDAIAGGIRVPAIKKPLKI